MTRRQFSAVVALTVVVWWLAIWSTCQRKAKHERKAPKRVTGAV